ncbi:hypothetical protein ASPZODRAFT_142073 [Penicilliopsis zonata CBS 506.65]|uniref:LysR family regulatory protein n=1 Tax=Penicilliopsis zonata CBS 506.65 TaxID=1073090 RepID=A0A1L9SJG5_9EURO|nr:hypothetical protein ASPZODRAFT_142073 [Penicilliopsis zonata CBS 506.65]OJJ47338.1 hypothetical protein ASPZODRAFT_142073 [Penicilliopsis zonata CBS 506.65]
MELPFWDDQQHIRAMSLDVTLRIDAALDATKLRSSLEKLLATGNWRRLGARLRKNNGKLCYQIPAEYTPSQPGVIFTTDHHEIPFVQHPLADKFPVATETPTVFDSPAAIATLLRAADAPSRLADWTETDRPQLAVHVVRFTDTTLLTLTFMHTLTDAMGLAGFLHAWTAVMRGEGVPDLYHGDPLQKQLEMEKGEDFIHSSRLLQGWRFMLFVFWYIFELFCYRDEMRTVCIPASYVDRLRNEALAQLPQSTFVSHGDVLLAWWLGVVVRAQNLSPSQPITVINVFDVRDILQHTQHTRVLSNMTLPSYTFLRARDCETLSLTAWKVRQSLLAHRTTPQIEASFYTQKHSLLRTGHLPVFGEPGMFLFAVSNWHKGRLFVDFSAAAQDTDGAKKAKTVQVICSGTADGFSVRNAGPVIGQDPDGNWWLSFTLRRETWRKVGRILNTV